MVATDGFRDSAGCFVEYGGQTSIRVPALEKTPSFNDPYTNNGDIGYSMSAVPTPKGIEWPVTGPIPSTANATSRPVSAIGVVSQADPNLKKIKMPISKKSEALADRPNGTGLHSRPTSPHSSSRSMSLESTITVYQESDDQLHYPQPETPPTDSVAVNRRETRPGISEGGLGRLLKLRRRVQLLRLQIQGQRDLVESKRKAQSDADEQYIKRIRTNHVARDSSEQMDTSELIVLEALWRQCQAARDAYGPAEDSLVSMENRLEIEEARLVRIEERLYQQLKVSKPESLLPNNFLEQDEEIPKEEEEDDDESSHQSSHESKSEDQNEYDEYLWRLGNLDLLQERHQNLINQRLALEEEQEKRRRVGIDLDIENIDFLARFEEFLEPVSKEVEEVTKDVERLKQICVEKGLIDIDGNPIQFPAIEESRGSDPGEERQSEMPAEHSKPSKYQRLSANNQVDSRVSASHGGYGPFVNLWLLHNLRSSAMEVLLLACYVATSVQNMDDLKWQAEARRLWEQDGAAKEGAGGTYEEDTESYIIPSMHGSNEETMKLGKDSGGISLPVKIWSRPRARSAPAKQSFSVKLRSL